MQLKARPLDIRLTVVTTLQSMRTPLPQGNQRPCSSCWVWRSWLLQPKGTPSTPVVLLSRPSPLRRTLKRLLALSVGAETPLKLWKGFGETF